ncbi:MAG: response regulator [Pirellulales bacterium]|nr:response regulator [Pirellulales bacterium]
MSKKVLVVDDSGTMRKIVIRALNASGFADTVEAADGAEALSVFQGSEIGLVLTDWNMPNKSGLDLTRDIRALGSKVPIFMITTEAEKGRVVEAIQAGITDYLTKPFTQEALQAKLEKYTQA